MINAASLSLSWRRHQVILGGLIAAAWLLLVTWALTPYAALLDHHAIEEGVFPAAVRWPAFIVGWTLMVVAMMLPGSLPTVRSFVQGAAARGFRAGRVLPPYMLGYVLIWVAFGAALYQGDTFLHAAVDDGLLPHAAEHLIPVVLLAVAGLYQFTPLKRRCLGKEHFVQGLVGERPADPLVRGASAGLLCVGTCGATMLVMFALGGGVNLLWMVALTAFTIIERTTERGTNLAAPLGVVLVLWAVLKLVA